MEYRRRSDEFAGNQIRLLLGDLKNSKAHNVKLKAIKTFETYIEEYYPDVSPAYYLCKILS